MMDDRKITEKLVDQIATDLITTHGLTEEDLRELGRRLQEGRVARRAANAAFAQRFMAEHAETFRRLGG